MYSRNCYQQLEAESLAGQMVAAVQEASITVDHARPVHASIQLSEKVQACKEPQKDHMYCVIVDSAKEER